MEPLPPPKPHPRLFVSERTFNVIKGQVRSDPVSRRLFECLHRKAGQFCAAPPCRYEMEGRRLLTVSRECLERVLTLAMMARLTDEARYARRAIEEMMSAAAFADWNPTHFLDAAEMTFALAVGYDWLHDRLSEHERDTIATAMLEKGLNPSLLEAHSWWVKRDNNWNQVCHASMVVGALVLAEREPALAAQMIERAVANIPLAARAYVPDGAYAEGPIYWAYGTSFHVMLIAALESALGRDYGLADGPGFLESAHYILQVTGPSGKFFNYSDSRESRPLQFLQLWFARRMNEPGLAQTELQHMDELLAAYESRDTSAVYRLLALALAWHEPRFTADGVEQPMSLPRHWLGRGKVPVGIHRSAWNDPAATYLAVKGGGPSAPHGHMDAGAFVLESGGVRWAVDLGMQDYHSVEKFGLKLFDHRQEGDRWKVFCLGSQGHNVPAFNGAPQLVTGDAPVVRFQADGAMPHTVVDLSSIYADQVARAWRGVGLLPDGRAVLQDEWTAGDQPAEMRWQMLTYARVCVEDGQISLAQDGRRLQLRIVEPTSGVEIEVLDKSEPAQVFDAPQPGARMIVLTCRTRPGQTQTLRLLASLSDAAADETPASLPLEQWSPPLTDVAEGFVAHGI